MAFEFSKQQREALNSAAAWYRKGDKQIYRVFGYAGVGKTTIARALAGEIGGHTCYAAFTGKAALQMQRAGCEDASTIHSLIYKVKDDDGDVRFVRNADSAASEADLIVIDECSMVDEGIARDLLSFGKPVLVLGDPAQLPPPKGGGGYFTEAEPDVMLTEIHRQAENDPILFLATEVREKRRLDVGEYGRSLVIPRAELTQRMVLSADQVLVGKNATRHTVNKKIRRLHGRAGPRPEEGDRVICLRNDREHGIFNGGMFRVDQHPRQNRTDDRFVDLFVRSEDIPGLHADVTVPEAMFGGGDPDLDRSDWHGVQQFDFGYAVTTHKAQGSQWESVVIFDESAVFREDAPRWLYTAITRASEQVIVVRGG